MFENDEAFPDYTGELSPEVIALTSQQYDLLSRDEAVYKARAQEFKEMYMDLTDTEKEFLRSTFEGQMIQLAYLGVKPAVALNDDRKKDFTNIDVVRFAHSPNINFVDGYLLNRQACAEVIAAQPEIYGTKESPQHFFDHTFPSNANKLGNAFKMGLLLGYPYEAVEEYYYGLYGVHLMQQVKNHPEFVQNASSQLQEAMRRSLEAEDIDDLPSFSSEEYELLEDELLALSDSLGIEDLSISEIFYVFNRRLLTSFGMSFVAANPNVIHISEVHLERVAKIYVESGLNEFLETEN